MMDNKPVNPLYLALMQSGGRALSAGANPNATNQSVLGAALTGFGPSYLAAQRINEENNLRQALAVQRDAQMKAAQQKAQRQQNIYDKVKSDEWFGSLPPNVQKAVAPLREAGAYGAALDAAKTMGTQKPTQPNAFSTFMTGDPKLQAMVMEYNKARTPSTSVKVENVMGKGATEASKALGTGYGNYAEGVYTDASTKRARISTLRRMNSLLEGVTTGPGTESLAQAKALFNRFVPGVFDERDIANVQAAQAVAGELVMKELNAMKGPATEKEREYLQKITADVSMTPESRAVMAYVAKRQAQRADELADFTTEQSEAVERGEISSSRARSNIRKYEVDLEDKYDESFDPPFQSLGGSEGGGGEDVKPWEVFR